MVVDAGDGKPYIAKPGGVYIATDRLQQLFAGVADVLIVDNDYACLRGEDIRDLLVSCGASRYLVVEQVDFGWDIPKRREFAEKPALNVLAGRKHPMISPCAGCISY